MFHTTTHFHFIGCSDTSMSGLALLMRQQGYTVSGCDTDISSSTCKRLIDEECTLFGGHNISHLKAADVIVYTAAFRHVEEVQYAKSHNKTVITHAELLGQLMRRSYGIVVAGSHGKTMTTALIAHLLRDTGQAPRFLVNGIMQNYKTQASNGSGEWFVAQARKSDPSLLHLAATLAVITGVDEEHVARHQSVKEVGNALSSFLQKLPFYGIAVICRDDKKTKPLLNAHQHHTITYGLDRRSDIRGEVVMLGDHHSLFNVYSKDNGLLGTVSLPVPGIHHVQSALGAITICQKLLGIPFKTLAKSCTKFAGVQRRFEKVGPFQKADVFDDCADHPNSIDATLTVARNAARRKLHVIFKPERYTRLNDLWDTFMDVFEVHAEQIDSLHILPLAARGEDAIEDISSEDLAEALREHTQHANLYCYQEDSEVLDAIGAFVGAGDLVLTIGPKEVAELARRLVRN